MGRVIVVVVVVVVVVAVVVAVAVVVVVVGIVELSVDSVGASRQAAAVLERMQFDEAG